MPGMADWSAIGPFDEIVACKNGHLDRLGSAWPKRVGASGAYQWQPRCSKCNAVVIWDWDNEMNAEKLRTLDRLSVLSHDWPAGLEISISKGVVMIWDGSSVVAKFQVPIRKTK
jgi:hypothetical protein